MPGSLQRSDSTGKLRRQSSRLSQGGSGERRGRLGRSKSRSKLARQHSKRSRGSNNSGEKARFAIKKVKSLRGSKKKLVQTKSKLTIVEDKMHVGVDRAYDDLMSDWNTNARKKFDDDDLESRLTKKSKAPDVAKSDMMTVRTARTGRSSRHRKVDVPKLHDRERTPKKGQFTLPWDFFELEKQFKMKVDQARK
eukprot:UN22719